MELKAWNANSFDNLDKKLEVIVAEMNEVERVGEERILEEPEINRRKDLQKLQTMLFWEVSKN